MGEEKSMLFNKAHAKVCGLLSCIKMDLISNEHKNKYIIGLVMMMVGLLCQSMCTRLTLDMHNDARPCSGASGLRRIQDGQIYS